MAGLALFPDTHLWCQSVWSHFIHQHRESHKTQHHTHTCTGSMGSLGFSARRETGEDGSTTLTAIKPYSTAG